MKSGETGKREGNSEGEIWVSEMAQWIKAIAAKPEDLSLISGTNIVGENQLLQVDLNMHALHMQIHIHTE